MAEKNFLEDGDAIEQRIKLPQHRPWWIIIVAGLGIAVLAAGAWYYNQQTRKANLNANINSFEQCRDVGGIILESYPEQCNFQGKTFTREVEPVSENPDETDKPQTDQPQLVSYTDTANGFSIQYPANFVQSVKEVTTPYTNTPVDITSQNFAHIIPIQHCNLKGDCTPTTTDFSFALSVVNSSMAKIEASKIKDELDNFTAGPNKYRYITQGVEGEGIYYYFIALPNGKSLMISRTYIDEFVLGGYKDAKDFIKKADQDKLAEQILASLSFGTGEVKTITNTTYNYSFNYGADFVGEVDVKGGIQKQEYFAGSGTTLEAVALKNDLFPKTTFSGGSLVVSVSSTTKTEAECKKFNNSGDNATGTLSGTQTVNGITWFTGITGGAAAGTAYTTKIYHTLHAGICFEIATTTAISNIGNYDPGTVTEVDQKAIQAKYDSVINSFKFTK